MVGRYEVFAVLRFCFSFLARHNKLNAMHSQRIDLQMNWIKSTRTELNCSLCFFFRHRNSVGTNACIIFNHKFSVDVFSVFGFDWKLFYMFKIPEKKHNVFIGFEWVWFFLTIWLFVFNTIYISALNSKKCVLDFEILSMNDYSEFSGKHVSFIHSFSRSLQPFVHNQIVLGLSWVEVFFRIR